MTLVISKGITLAKVFTWNETVWNPSMISTALWLDASDSTTLFTTDVGSTLVTSGDTVGRWNDKSGNSLNVSQSSSSQRPTYALNALAGKPVLVFDGSNDILFRSTGLNNVPNVTIISVFRVVTAAGADLFMGIGATGATGAIRGIYRDNTSNALWSAGWARDFTSTLDTDPGGGYHIFGLMNTSLSTPNNFQAHRDGVVQIGSSGGGNLDNTAAGFSVGSLRGSAVATYYSNIETAEIVVLTSAADTTTRQKIEGYLAHKWGLTANLPNDHPYKTVGPTP
jgi:hypothetical protein